MTTENFQVQFSDTGAKEILRTFDAIIAKSETAEAKTAALKRGFNEANRAMNPLQRSYEGYAKSVKAVEAAQGAGVISIAQAAKAQSGLAARYSSTLRPLGVLTEKIKLETAAWQQNAQVRRATISTSQQVIRLQRQGISANEETVKSLQRQNLALQESKRQSASLTAGLAAENRKRVSDAGRAASELERIQRNSGTSVQVAQGRRDRALQAISNSGSLDAGQKSALSAKVSNQFAESAAPLGKSNRLLNERIAYQEGLVKSGRNLAAAEREVARAVSRGIEVDQESVRSLRQRSTAQDRAASRQNAVSSIGTSAKNFGLGIISAGGIQQATELLDLTTTLNNRLNLVAKNPENRNFLFKELAKQANDTRTPIEDTIRGFSRLALNAERLGVSQKEVFDVTKTISQTIQISGASAQEASAGFNQLTQALASDRLAGDELKSILENVPALAQTIVSGLNKIGTDTNISDVFKQAQADIKATGEVGTVTLGKLRELGKDGKINGQLLFRSIQVEEASVATEFAKTLPTIANALAAVRTNFIVFLDDMNKGVGLSNFLVAGIMLVANNIKTLVPILAALGIAFVLANAANTFIKLGKHIGDLRGKMIANNAIKAQETAGRLANVGAINAETAAQVRQNLSNAVGANVGKVKAATGAAGALAAGAGALPQAVAATGAISAVGTAATATTGIFARLGTAASGALSLVARVGGFALRVLLPWAGILLGIAAAWGVLKDNISLSEDRILGYDVATKKVIRGQISLGDVVGSVFGAIGQSTYDSLIKPLFEFGAASGLISDKVSKDSSKVTDLRGMNLEIDAQNSAGSATEQLSISQGLTEGTLSNYDSMSDGWAKTIINIVANASAGATALVTAFSRGLQLIGQGFVNFGNMVGNILRSIFGGLSSLGAAISSRAGQISELASRASEAGVPGAGAIAAGASGLQALATRASGGAANTGRAIPTFSNVAVIPQSAIGVSANVARNSVREGLASRVLQSGFNRARAANAGGFDTSTGAGGGGAAPSAGEAGKKKGGEAGKKKGGGGKKGKSEAEKAQEKADKERAKAREELISSLASLQDELNPVAKATKEYAEKQKLLSDSLSAGLLTQEQYADSVSRLKFSIKDTIDPTTGLISVMGELNNAMERDTEALTFSIDEREQSLVVAKAMRDAEAKLGRGLTDTERSTVSTIEAERKRRNGLIELQNQIKGIEDAADQAGRTRFTEGKNSLLPTLDADALRQAQSTLGTFRDVQAAAVKTAGIGSEDSTAVKQVLDTYRERLAQEVELNLASAKSLKLNMAVVQTYESLANSADNYVERMTVLNTLLEQGKIGMKAYQSETIKVRLELLETATDGFSGFERALLRAQTVATDMASSVDSIFSNMFSGIEDQFVGLSTGKGFDFKSILETTAADVSRAFYRREITPLLGQLGGKLGIQGFGDSAVTDQTIKANAVYINGVALGTIAPNVTPGVNPELADYLTKNNVNSPFLAGLRRPANDNAVPGISAGQPVPVTIADVAPLLDFGQNKNIANTTSPTEGVLGAITDFGFGKSLPQTASAPLDAIPSILQSLMSSMPVGGGGGGIGKAGGGGLSSLISTFGSLIPGFAPFAGAIGGLGSLFGFRDGGSFDVGGAGGPDSKIAAFKVTPGENVTIRRPDQMNDNNAAPAPLAPDNKIVNVLDPQMALDALQSNRGQRTLLNVIQSNPQAVKRALGI